MTEKPFKIVGLGEVLWDCLPDGKQLGGAPANFAHISTQLGNYGIVASRVGNDNDGNEILQSLENVGIDISLIQKDTEFPTGTVKVWLENGQPSYQITENVAWDFLELSDDWQKLAENCDAVCFGTLAQRNSVSRKTIQEFVRSIRGLRIFDFNLRQNYYSREISDESLTLADVVKLNHEEFPVVTAMFALKGADIIEQARNLLEKYDLQLVCVTRGSNGSFLVTATEVSEHQGEKIEIADTIGAGDAFTATMTHGLLQGWDLDVINQKANKIGALVASQRGAMPAFPKDFKL